MKLRFDIYVFVRRKLEEMVIIYLSTHESSIGAFLVECELTLKLGPLEEWELPKIVYN